MIIKQEIQANMEEIKEMFESISGKLQTMDGKLSEVIEELKDIKLENEVMKKQIKNQETKIASLEREVRRRNLVFKGVPEKEKEGIEETMENTVKICQSLGVNVNPAIDIDEVRRLGRPEAGKQRPILLKVTTTNRKREILKKAKGLKGSDIWIDEDYPKEIQEERKLLIPKLKEARSKGHKAQLKYNKLIIDNKVYDISSLKPKEKTSQGNVLERDRKRKTNMRSPEADKLEEQLRKVTRAKNE